MHPAPDVKIDSTKSHVPDIQSVFKSPPWRLSEEIVQPGVSCCWHGLHGAERFDDLIFRSFFLAAVLFRHPASGSQHHPVCFIEIRVVSNDTANRKASQSGHHGVE